MDSNCLELLKQATVASLTVSTTLRETLLGEKNYPDLIALLENCQHSAKAMIYSIKKLLETANKREKYKKRGEAAGFTQEQLQDMETCYDRFYDIATRHPWIMKELHNSHRFNQNSNLTLRFIKFLRDQISTSKILFDFVYNGNENYAAPGPGADEINSLVTIIRDNLDWMGPYLGDIKFQEDRDALRFMNR